MDRILCFIKFTEHKFAESLLKKGQVFFNLPSSYNKLDEKERGDGNEGAEWIDNSQLVNIKAEYPYGTFEFKPMSNSPSKITQYNYYFLSFSLYAITSAHFNNDKKHQIDSRLGDFGDTAVIIEQPYDFLDSVITELKKNNLKYEIKLINYRDLTNARVDLVPFDKKLEHQHQCEFRIIIENTEDIVKIIEIGSIEKYSRLINSKHIIESIWTAK